jgi:multiple sugar transport system permease protein
MIEAKPIPNTAVKEKVTRRNKWLEQLPLHITLVVILIFMLLPFFWMVATSLKPDVEATPSSLSGSDKSIGRFLSFFWPGSFQIENYRDAWLGRYSDRLPIVPFWEAAFSTYFLNTIISGVARTVGVLITSILAAWAFARMEFWGKNILFALILTTLAIPDEAQVIPNLVIVKLLGLSNNFGALIVPWLASAFYIFLLRQFFQSIPQELYEAGQIDGVKDLGFLWRIGIPLSMPAILTCTLFSFLSTWNAFLWPQVAAPNIPVVQVGLLTFIGNTEVLTQWNLLMAAATIVTIPIVVLYFLVQRTFIEGVSRTGIK